MYGGNYNFITGFLVLGLFAGLAIAGAIWAFFVWLWPVLKVWLHTVTA